MPFAFGGVRMEYDVVGQYNVAQACITNTFYLEPEGALVEGATARTLGVLGGSQLVVNGSFLSTAADGRCPIMELPPEPPPTGGSGGAGGVAGAPTGGAGGAGSGGVGGAPPVTEYTCLTTSVLGTNDTCVCTACNEPGCGSGTCAGFSECCGTSDALGSCQCTSDALGSCQCALTVALTCDDIAALFVTLGTPLTPVAACP